MGWWQLWLPGPDTNPDAVCNPAQDCLLAEVDGKVIGYTWLAWWEEMNGTKLSLHLGWFIMPGDIENDGVTNPSSTSITPSYVI